MPAGVVNNNSHLSPRPRKRRFDLLDILNPRNPMGPRKKSKSNKEAKLRDTQPTSESSEPSNTPPQPESLSQNVDVPKTASLESSVLRDSDRLASSVPDGSLTEANVANKKSWYGSWKGKTRPTSEIVRDNAPASPTTPRAPSVRERRESTPNAPSPRRIMSSNHRPQGKAAPIQASISKLSVTSSGLAEDKPEEGPVKKPGNETVKRPGNETAPVPDPPLPPDPAIEQKPNGIQDKKQPEPQTPAAGWFGWWSRPDGYIEKDPKDARKDTKDESTAAQDVPIPGDSPTEERTQPKLTQDLPQPPESGAKPAGDSDANSTKQNTGSHSRSWFWLWSAHQNSQPNSPEALEGRTLQSPETSSKPPEADIPVPPAVLPEIPEPNDGTATPETTVGVVKGPERRKSTGWAFWSRDKPESEDTGQVHKQVGELAVANTPSQTNPEAAQFNEQEEAAPKEPPSKEPPKSIARSIRGSVRGISKGSGSSAASSPAKTTPSHSPTRKSTESAKQPQEEAKRDTNLLLPAFRDTFSPAQQPTFIEQIRRLFIGEEKASPHLHIAPNPPRIRKALAIGIHGFFPSPLFQKVLGQPTGTSIRFANCAAQSIKSWTEEKGYECEIEKIALEGEGFIADRVDTLWKLLLNWIDHIRQADFILVACHSQGVPVSITLVAKLIAFGCVSSTKIGICAMAGVNLGPFAEYKTRMFGGSALELFDFSNPNTKVSQSYQNALEEVLKYGVKICYVGSIDDQLVSLESSTFSTVTHPNIYRAVFIDGRLHAADFITHLVGFCLKLRNLGLPDHGLIRELSPALAGSLYTGEGHSSLHNYLPIYQLAVQHALETTSLDKPVDVKVRRYEGPPGAKDANPFFLPWAMRGILEEEVVRRELGEELPTLLRLFEEWKPVSKGLKDVKFRLEAIRSKL